MEGSRVNHRAESNAIGAASDAEEFRYKAFPRSPTNGVASSCFGFVVGFLMIFPALLSQWRMSRWSTFVIFQDWDEPFYYSMMRDFGALSWSSLVENFPDMPLDFPYFTRFYAHSIVDFIGGFFVNSLNLSPATLLLGLDFVCIAAALFAYEHFFRVIGVHRAHARISALLSVTLPYCPSVLEGWAKHYLPALPTFEMGVFPSLPAMRGMYLQTVLPVFLLALSRFIEFVSGNRARVDGLLFGLLSGLLLYWYFFAWLTFGFLGAMFGLVALVTGSAKFKDLVKFGIAHVIVIVPGMILTLGMPSAMNMTVDEQKGYEAWLAVDYLSVMLLVWLLLAGRKYVGSLANRTYLVLLTSEFLLANLEWLTQRMILPYHFSLFFIRPLLVGLLGAALLARISAIYPLRRPVIITIQWLLITLAFLSQFVAVQRRESIALEVTEFSDTIIARRAPGLQIAMPTFEVLESNVITESSLPQAFEAMLNINTQFGERQFKQLLGKNESYREWTLLREGLIEPKRAQRVCQALKDGKGSEAVEDHPLARWYGRALQMACRNYQSNVITLCSLPTWEFFPETLVSTTWVNSPLETIIPCLGTPRLIGKNFSMYQVDRSCVRANLCGGVLVFKQLVQEVRSIPDYNERE